MSTNLFKMHEFVEKKDLEKFNIELMSMIIKLQKENDFLKEQLKHLETTLLNDNRHLTILSTREK